MSSSSSTNDRLDLVVAFSIALVSISAALVVWRGSTVSSSAGDSSRKLIIDTVRQQAGANEDWRKTYQEAAFAQNYAAYAAQLKAMADSADKTTVAQADYLRQYLLPNLQQMAPLAQDKAYLNRDGTFDLQHRFEDLQAENSDLASLDPQIWSKQAASYSAEQRWLTVDAILLTIALFWLSLAQISRARLRKITLAIGVLAYLGALAALGLIEVIYVVTRGAL